MLVMHSAACQLGPRDLGLRLQTCQVRSPVFRGRAGPPHYNNQRNAKSGDRAKLPARVRFVLRTGSHLGAAVRKWHSST